MKRVSLVFALIFISSPLFAQNTVEKYIREGVEYHDKGDYDQAISTYKKALKVDAKSPIANYEIALSYFKKGDYEKVIKYSDVVIKQNAKYMLEAYMVKGSALDLLGRTKESIKLFEKAIKKTEGHYLLYYNLALNHYNLKDYDEAEKNALKAIEMNPNHGSSHLILINLHNIQGNKVQTLLVSHFFLLIEPNSKRSSTIHDILLENFGGNVTRDSDEPNTITINLDPSGDDEFMSAEMMIGLLAASGSLEENEGKTDDEMFIENTKSFFSVMGELRDDKATSMYWTFYTPFLYDIALSDHMEAYCKYITQSGNDDSEEWLAENEDKLKAFNNWLQTK